MATSGRTATLAECVPGLYTDRIRPTGRIDTWWLDADLTLATSASRDLPAVRDLAGYTITVNGTRLPLDVPAAIHACRTALNPAGRWSTALTQGDPTEPNIVSTAAGACWLDFEYADRNTIAGEIANLLGYLLALGGWLVPLPGGGAVRREGRRPGVRVLPHRGIRLRTDAHLQAGGQRADHRRRPRRAPRPEGREG